MEYDLSEVNEAIEQERYKLLHEFEALLDPVVMVLGFVWLMLLVIELAWTESAFLRMLAWVIWGVFLIDFGIRFTIAPRKTRYLRSNWLAALSLLLPGLRIFHLTRLAPLIYSTQAVREIALIDVLSSLRDSLRTLRLHMKRRGIALVVAMTTLVTLVGAAAMYYFENIGPGEGFKNYWDALYWTGMMMTNFGSSYWPVSEEGRVLAFIMAVYAFTIFGYTTATLATFLISREAQSKNSELSTSKSIQSLQDEVRALRTEIRELKERPPITPDS